MSAIPSASGFVFNHFNTPSVKIRSVKFFESILHIGIRGKINNSVNNSKSLIELQLN